MSKPNTSHLAEGSTTIGGKYLIFEIDQVRFAVPLLEVQEIVKIDNLRSEESKSGSLVGAMQLRNKVLQLVRLPVSNAREEVSSKDGLALVVKAHEKFWGICVDDVIEVVHLHESEFSERSSFVREENGAFVSSYAKVQNTLVGLVEISQWIERKLTGLSKAA